MNKILFFLLISILMASVTFAQLNSDAPRVKTENGVLEGVNESGIKTFKGVPFAASSCGRVSLA